MLFMAVFLWSVCSLVSWFPLACSLKLVTVGYCFEKLCSSVALNELSAKSFLQIPGNYSRAGQLTPVQICLTPYLVFAVSNKALQVTCHISKQC